MHTHSPPPQHSIPTAPPHIYIYRYAETSYSNAFLSSELLSIERAGVHGMEGHFTGSCQNWSGLGEEIIICCLTLNGSDQHGVTSILVGLEFYRGGREEREGGGESASFCFT